MRSIKTTDLKPGQKFDKPVYIDGVNMLVPENVPLREGDIKRLTKWQVTEVSTEGKLIDETPAGRQETFFQRAFNTPAQRQVMKSYATLSDRLKSVHTKVTALEDVSTSDIDSIVDGILQLLQHHRNDVVEYILYGFQGAAGFTQNAVNAAVLALLVGINMNMVQHKLLHLATAALLHDVGMMRLPRDIVYKKGKLTPEEAKTVRTHPIHSYKIITRELKYSEEIGIAALQHQERWDGGGYPKGLSGNQIYLPARIIAVVDSFEAMVSRRPYRSSMIGYTAMRNILSDNARRFDPEILKTFIRTMGIYPIGSIVLLNNSCIGRVVENNTDAPLKPKVKIMIDEHGREYENDEGEVLDLFTDRKIFIAKAVDPKELADKEKA